MELHKNRQDRGIYGFAAQINTCAVKHRAGNYQFKIGKRLSGFNQGKRVKTVANRKTICYTDSRE